jgi:hypothetical protein
MADSPTSAPVLASEDARQVLRLREEKAIADRSDQFYLRESYGVRDLASKAYQSFGGSRSPLRNLERVALSAVAFGDIIDFVKSQTGRSTKIGKKWQKNSFGPRLHDMLWERVREEAEEDAEQIFNELETPVREALEEDGLSVRDLQRRLRLAYAQRYIQHLVAHFEYLEGTSSR